MVWLHRWCSDKESACIAGDIKDGGLIPGLGRSPREENGNSFQYSCLGNPTDRGAWMAAVHGVTNDLDTIEWLNNNNKIVTPPKIRCTELKEFKLKSHIGRLPDKENEAQTRLWSLWL